MVLSLLELAKNQIEDMESLDFGKIYKFEQILIAFIL